MPSLCGGGWGEGGYANPFSATAIRHVLAPCTHSSPTISERFITWILPLSPRHPSFGTPCQTSDEPRYLGSLSLRHFVRIRDRVSVQGRLGRPRGEQHRQSLLFETPLEVDPVRQQTRYAKSTESKPESGTLCTRHTFSS